MKQHLCFASVLLAWDPGHALEQPNILFIAVDDLRPELRCYGESHIISPHIDRLAAQGVVFTRAYCQQAVCNASRASLMTGLRPDSTGVVDNRTHFREKVPEVVTLPQRFKESGYRTQAFGKIYHGAFATASTGRKFDDPPSWSEPSWQGSPRYYFTARGEQVAREIYGKTTGKKGAALDDWKDAFVSGLSMEAPDVPDSMLYDGQMTDLVIDALHEIEEGRRMVAPDKYPPFFLAVGYLKPHAPFVAPKKYWDLYQPGKLSLASNLSPPEGAPPWAFPSWKEIRRYVDIPKEGPPTADQARQLRQGYYACVSFVDAQIGRLLEELDRLGLRDDTIVILWGDHGYHLGEHGYWCKATNFERDTRAPLIISVPGARANGRRADALVEFVDIYPSLCELAGLIPPPYLEGTSFVPLLDDPTLPWKTAAFSQYPRPGLMGYSMRTQRHRLVVWQSLSDPDQVKAVELYDHQIDPAEDVNIAGLPENAALVSELTAKLRQNWRNARPVMR